MATDFRDRDRDLRGSARRRFWSRELPALVRAALAQHLSGIWRDIRFATRVLARSPGFTAAAIVMLAIGTGANAAMFSVVDAVMLRSAFPDPARIVAIEEQAQGQPERRTVPLSHLAPLSAVDTFDGVAAITGSLPVMTGPGAPRRLDIECVSASMFSLLGTRPIVGRVFRPEEDQAGAAPVLVLNHRTWMRDFQGATDIVGRTVLLNGQANTIIGVMPADFLGPYATNKIDAWAPLMPAAGQQSPAGCELRRSSDDPDRIRTTVQLVARVRAPRTLQAATAELNAMGVAARLPLPENGIQPNRILLIRADEFLLPAIRAPFLALLGAVGCVLLIGCANVANLQLERLVGRRKELAIRLALGATHGRIIRQTLVENLLVSLAGAACGVAVARLALQGIVSMIPVYVPHVAEIAIDERTLIVTAVVAIVTGLGVGLVPAWQATRPVVANDLRASGGRVAGGAQLVRRSLVVAEVALSVALLIGAVLMLRTFLTLRPTNPGFAAENRLKVEVLMDGDWKVDRQREQFVNAVLESVRRLPGVQSVSATSYVPLSGQTNLARIVVGETAADVWSSWVTPHYVQDMSMTLVRGRTFTPTDDASAPPVAMINQALAARFWPTAEPVGQLIEVTAPDRSTTRRQIVGVLSTTRSWGTDREERSELYIPYAQNPGSTLMYFIVTTNGPPPVDLPAQITARITALRPNQDVFRIEPLQTSVDRSVAQPRFAAWLFGAFAAMAVGLAALGLAAVIAWWVSQRSREIGVRVALGADARRVSGLVIRQALGLAITGVALGLGVAALTTRILGAWLYGITPLDPVTFVGAAAGMLGTAVVAAALPARRAARIDPIVTLRAE